MENCIINYIWHPVRSFLLILGTDWDSSDFKTSNSYNETHILAPSPLVRLRNDLRRWRERVAREGAQMRLICGTKFTSGQRIYVSQSPRINSMLSTLANSVLDCGGPGADISMSRNWVMFSHDNPENGSSSDGIEFPFICGCGSVGRASHVARITYK